MKGTKRLFIMKKSQIVTVALICMLVLAGYLNFVSAPPEETVEVSGEINEEIKEEIPPVENYGEARFVSNNTRENSDYEREIQLSRAKEVLKELSENKDISPEQRSEAEKKLVELGENMVSEANIASVLSSSGMKISSVVVGDGGVTVTLGEKPDEKTLNIIRDTAMREAGVSADKIFVKIQQ